MRKVFSLSPLVLLILLGSTAATSTEVPRGDQTAASSLAAAEEAVAEGLALARQETGDALREALVKYQAAAEMFRAAGERKRLAQTLQSISETYGELH